MCGTSPFDSRDLWVCVSAVGQAASLSVWYLNLSSLLRMETCSAQEFLSKEFCEKIGNSLLLS